MHGIQSWLALPLDHEETEPSFLHHPATAIPETSRDGVRLRVLVGAAYGLVSPAHVFSPTFYEEAVLPAGARLSLPEEYEERAAYVVGGAIACDGEEYGEGDMLVVHPNVSTVVQARSPSRLMLLGGARIDGVRHIWWNFVSSSKARIEQAKRDWTDGRFGKIRGDEVEFIPLPD